MSNLVVRNGTVLITCGSRAFALNIDSQCNEVLNVPRKSVENEERVADINNDTSCSAEVVAADVSRCGKFIVLCTSDKNLSLWKIDGWSLVSTRVSARVGSKVRFVPSGQHVVLADKSGDAYRFSIQNPNEEGEMLLGHLSMLLDVLVSPDEKFIITCDRDEKIRVSKYPNAYNIQSYCLGHKEFVSTMSFLPHDKTVLVSSSGDGSVRFWDFVAGVQLNVIDCSGDIFANKDIVKDSKVEEGEECILPVKQVTCCVMNDKSSIICCSVAKIIGCIVYNVSSCSKTISVDLTHVMKLKAEPWDMLLTSKRELWILGPVHNEPLSVLLWDCSTCQFEHADKSSVVTQVNSRWDDLFQSITPTVLLPVLYKRKFDNIQVYQEKKKQRLTTVLGSSCTNTAVK